MRTRRRCMRQQDGHAGPAQRLQAGLLTQRDSFACLDLASLELCSVMQALEAMPLKAPEAPVGQAALWRAASATDCGPELLVPAAAVQALLQPAKMAVWRLHAEQVS